MRSPLAKARFEILGVLLKESAILIPDLGVNTCFILMASRDPASYANPTGEGKIRKNSSYLKECAISHNLLFKACGNHLLRHQGFFKATDPHLGRQDLKYASFFLECGTFVPNILDNCNSMASGDPKPKSLESCTQRRAFDLERLLFKVVQIRVRFA